MLATSGADAASLYSFNALTSIRVCEHDPEFAPDDPRKQAQAPAALDRMRPPDTKRRLAPALPRRILPFADITKTLTCLTCTANASDLFTSSLYGFGPRSDEMGSVVVLEVPCVNVPRDLTQHRPIVVNVAVRSRYCQQMH